MTRRLVDASNVIGSKPDGWWRDREGATRRLLDALREAGEEAVVVLDAAPEEWAGREGSVEVVIAPRRGRDAADDEIVRLVAADDDPASISVVTSDSGLAARVRALGASVEAWDEDGRPLVEETVRALLASPTTSKEELKLAFASLTIGSGAAAAVLTRGERAPGAPRLVGGLSRAATEHHVLCHGDRSEGASAA